MLHVGTAECCCVSIVPVPLTVCTSVGPPFWALVAVRLSRLSLSRAGGCRRVVVRFRYRGWMSQAHWIAELRKVGFVGTDDRVAVIAGVLVSNLLSSFRRMRFAGDPSSWLGAETLSTAEIQFLANCAGGAESRRDARSRSRARAVVQVRVGLRCSNHSVCLM